MSLRDVGRSWCFGEVCVKSGGPKSFAVGGRVSSLGVGVGGMLIFLLFLSYAGDVWADFDDPLKKIVIGSLLIALWSS